MKRTHWLKKTFTIYNIAVLAGGTSCSKAYSKESGSAKELLAAEENVLGEENLHDLQHSGRGELNLV